jgi:hypothetical protein
MEGAIRLALAIWKNAVVENAETGEGLDHRILEIRQLPREVLVYRDIDAHRAWAQDGATSENADTMVHFIAGTESITVVVDDPRQAQMRALLEAISQHVGQDIFWMRAYAA